MVEDELVVNMTVVKEYRSSMAIVAGSGDAVVVDMVVVVMAAILE